MRSLVLCSLVLPGASLAATLRVPEDHPTLLAAVTAAADGDEILVSSTYVFASGPVEVTKSILIRGETSSATIPPLLVHDGASVDLETLTLGQSDELFTGLAGTLGDRCDQSVGSFGPSLSVGVCVSDAALELTGVRGTATLGNYGVYGFASAVTLSNFTCDGMVAPAVRLEDSSDVNVYASEFTGCVSPLQVQDSALYVEASAFHDNLVDDLYAEDASGPGGADIRAWSSDVDVYGTVFTATADHDAGGGGSLRVDNGGSLQLWGETTFSGYSADYGGVLYASDLSSVQVMDTQITDVSSYIRGGAMYVELVPFVELREAEFTGLSTANDGGVLFQWGGGLDVISSTFDGCDAVSGGVAFLSQGGSLRVEGSAFRGCVANKGGAFYLEGPGVTGAELVESAFVDGDATDGGVLWVADPDRVELDTCFFCQNHAHREGSVLAIERPAPGIEVEIHHNVLYGNTTDQWADNPGGSTLTMLSSAEVTGVAKVAHNTFFMDDGRAHESGGASVSLPVHGLVVDSNIFSLGGPAVSTPATVVPTGGYNLFHQLDPEALRGGAVDLGAAPGTLTADPLLVLAADGVSCDDLDVHLKTGSPAVDAGNPEETDADGTRSDMGAYGALPGDPIELDQDGDGHQVPEDCDDEDSGVHPGADEVCNGRDDDCDDAVDEDAVDATKWWLDADGDGWGAGEAVRACVAPRSDYADRGGDCDDRDGHVHPEAGDSPWDGVDANCDGAMEETRVRAGGCSTSRSLGVTPWALLGLLLLRRRFEESP